MEDGLLMLALLLFGILMGWTIGKISYDKLKAHYNSISYKYDVLEKDHQQIRAELKLANESNFDLRKRLNLLIDEHTYFNDNQQTKYLEDQIELLKAANINLNERLQQYES